LNFLKICIFFRSIVLSPEKCAEIVINAIINRMSFVTIPKYYGIIISVFNVLPFSVQHFIRDYRNEDLFLKNNKTYYFNNYWFANFNRLFDKLSWYYVKVSGLANPHSLNNHKPRIALAQLWITIDLNS